MTEPALCSPDHKNGCLEGLPLRKYQYQGRHHFYRILDDEIGRRERAVDEPEHVLFSIDPVDLQHDFLDPSSSCFSKVRFSYDIEHSLVLVKMPSKEHGAATGTLASEVSKQLGRMGPNVENEIVAFSGSGIRAEGRGKEADFAWGPQVPPDAVEDSGSVTVAVEVAVSQKPTMLKRDIDYWLSPTAGNANLVIAVKVGRSDPEVSIELWRQADRGAHRTQHTIIKKVNSRVIILGDEVTIPFKDLLGRERSAPGEIDVTITKEQLERVARAIWSQQRF